MSEFDDVFDEFTIAIPYSLGDGIAEIRGITRETLSALLSMERERGFYYGLEVGLNHLQEKECEMVT